MQARRALEEVAALTRRELVKWLREPVPLVMMLIQPVLWIGLFGKAFNLTGMLRIPEDLLQKLPPYATQVVGEVVSKALERLFGAPGVDYFSYMAAGMACVVAFFAGFSSAMSLSWDRRFGYLNKLLVTPISRGSVFASKVLGGAARGVLQSAILLLVAAALGMKLNPMGPGYVALAALGLALLAVSFASLFVAITLNVKSWETQMAVMNLLNLPLMFASNVLYPTSSMPPWLRPFAEANPLSFCADLVRQALLYGAAGSPAKVLGDLAVLAAVAAALVAAGWVASEKALKGSK